MRAKCQGGPPNCRCGMLMHHKRSCKCGLCYIAVKAEIKAICHALKSFNSKGE